MNAVVFSIPADHPCLAGHFPGDPIVPGVVVLDRVIDAVQGQADRGVTGIRRCKFARPLRPGERCTAEWTRQEDTVRFVCTVAQDIVASGVLELVEGQQ